jgi:hypothetical protein
MTAVLEQPAGRTLNDPLEVRFTPQEMPLAGALGRRLWPAVTDRCSGPAVGSGRNAPAGAGPGTGTGAWSKSSPGVSSCRRLPRLPCTP